MLNHKVSLRYATSLLETSLEKNSLDTISGEVDLVHRTLAGSPDLNRMLRSPVIKNNLKLAVLNDVFRNKIGTELIHFISFILEKGREDQLVNILEKFIELRDDRLGFITVNVASAFEFTQEQSEKLKSIFENKLNKKVILKVSIDRNMIGGFTAKVNDTVYDASVRHQLELIRKEFLSGGASLN